MLSQDLDNVTLTEPTRYAGAGKRRAINEPGRGDPGSSRRFLRPPVCVLVGLAAITLATGGALGGVPVGATNAVAAPPTNGHAVPTAEVQHQPSSRADAVNQVGLVISRSALRREAPTTSGAAAAAKRREQALRQLRAAANRREGTLRQRQVAAERRAAAAEARRRWIELNRWTLPVASYRLTAFFGESSYLWSTVHTGLDFAAPEGSPISSVAAGTVTEAGYAGSYGYRTIITHADGTETWYGHQSSIGVVVGESVGRGEVIGLVGSTGNVTGPHLHLEVRPGGGDPEDPYTALAARGARP